VTHNWGNLFRDLVAAMVADALGEVEFDRVCHLLTHDFEQVVAWVTRAGKDKKSYWVCAFCINQHTCICGGNPFRSKDAVTGEEHAVCDCGSKAILNTTEPLLTDSMQSIPCELNKFDDMIEFLSAPDPRFTQVIAVDVSFVLFSRAWCVAEVAASHRMGMEQKLKIVSIQALHDHEEDLSHLRIQDMNASRPEDKEEILRKIPNHELFNDHLKALLFNDLLPAWGRMDLVGQLDRAGQVLRYLRWREHEKSSEHIDTQVIGVPEELWR